LDLTVADGRLTASPLVRLDPEPAEMFLGQGPMLANVRVSPEICDAALKFIAPVVADATRTEGRFSVALEGGRIPLGEPLRGDVAGRLTVHQLQVLPGPLGEQILFLARQIEAIAKRRQPLTSLSEVQGTTLLKIDDQQIPFRMVQGRVYHERLEMKSGDVVVRTHGSVGLDQTLALVVDVPVQDKWIQDEPLAQVLKGETIQITVGGTLRQPRIDRRAVEQLTAKILRGAAEKAVSGQIEKLFGPRR